jgi:dCMP deaminase
MNSSGESIMTNWDKRYMELACCVASWSKDPSSKIGAVAVNEKGQILTTGYNGFPRGIADDERLNDRPTKYKYIVHAEMNAIYNATYNGVSLDGSTMYVAGLPCCSECAKGIIQVGVKRVVMNGDIYNERWSGSVELTLSMFNEAGVEWEIM